MPAVDMSLSLDEEGSSSIGSNIGSNSNNSYEANQGKRQVRDLRSRGTGVSLQDLQNTFARVIQLQLVDVAARLLQLMKLATANSKGAGELLPHQQLEQYMQLLCQQVSSSVEGHNKQQCMLAVQQLVAESLAGTQRWAFSIDAVAAYATAAAASLESGRATAADVQQQLMHMAPAAVLIDLAVKFAAKQQAKATARLVKSALFSISKQAKNQEAKLIAALADKDSNNMPMLLRVLGSSADGFQTAVSLLEIWLAQEQHFPNPAALAFLETAAQQSHLQPARAAVHLGFFKSQQLAAAAGAGATERQLEERHADQQTQQQDSKAAAQCSNNITLIASVCDSLCHSTSDNSQEQLDFSWVGELSAEAAATALFSCWLWQVPRLQPGNCTAAEGTAANAQLLLTLYHHLRKALAAKPSIDSLLLDLGLCSSRASSRLERR